ncbi:MAG TPA: carbamoyl-phosphate synthase large subunit [Polyangiaceae bacterium]|nr:carbamoyl-phosphate synthase large subunit [Polyangiaceae bacterium]
MVEATGFPAIIRPAFTLGGSGGGIAESERDFEEKVAWALAQSPSREVLIEESVLGWKEYELEVIRDRKDNFIVVCSIENIDPMGVHTGDSITVAPAMTLTDREFQRLRDAARAVMTEIGVETGGSNVQFSVDPKTGKFHVIEMNPRVSRSSALASKATGYPIAKIAAKLAVGFTLDELENDITRTSAAFEPTIDYVVVKWPRFAFEKFPSAKAVLGPQMKSVGEAMSIGRTFREALGKAIRSLETGGSNVQFAVSPKDGRVVVVEMNPRVSRSSALASKATGYPIAKIAAKLAVGYRLDELVNDITGTSAAFEPTIDYVVVKWPRFAFEKFPGADQRLGTQMKSVGEVMAIGRTFAEALQKAARSLETGKDGLMPLSGRVDYAAMAADPNSGRDLVMEAPREPREPKTERLSDDALKKTLLEVIPTATADRLFYVCDALRAGATEAEVVAATAIDPWFIAELGKIVRAEREIDAGTLTDKGRMYAAKRLGLSDKRLAALAGTTEDAVRAARRALGVRPVFGRVDTCAAEFPAHTPYLYSTYEESSESAPTDRKKVVILGGGPNRIGQGIEFDYCCVHAAFALRAAGVETIMVNCNPETVSTDYDTSDRLYFEPLTLEDVLEIVEEERQGGTLLGVIVQYGGQTPLKLSQGLAAAGVPILGTSADAIDRAEDRGRFEELLEKLGILRARGAIARGVDDAFKVAADIGYPVVVRPSYVLGGRAMMICHDEADLKAYIHLAVEAAREAGTQAILVDEFLGDAIEVDVDAVGDGHEVVIGGVMQHIEEAGVHSGDSASVLPPHSLPKEIVLAIEEQTKKLGTELGVVGLMNVQFAVKDGQIYVLEVNPRASRTVPFVSKATGRPLAKIAVDVMLGAATDGKKLADLGVRDAARPKHVSVKESVFPFAKFPGVDTQLGPEMRSTGEVMGIAESLAVAFGKAQIAAGVKLPRKGKVFISVKESDKPGAALVAKKLASLGFELVATSGTAEGFAPHGITATIVKKVREGSPHIVDLIKAGEIALVVNTTIGAKSIKDSYSIRRQTLLSNVPICTTIPGAMAFAEAIEADVGRDVTVESLQEWHG